MKKLHLSIPLVIMVLLTLLPGAILAAQSPSQALGQDLQSFMVLIAQLDKRVQDADMPSTSHMHSEAKPAVGSSTDAPATQAEENKDDGLRVDISLPYYTKYMSRGLLFVNDPVLQPWFTLAYKGFSLNFWGNYNLTGKINRKNKFTEVDITGEYAFELGDFTIPLGVTQYLYPNSTQPSSTEIYSGVSYKWFVTPALKVYRDVGDVHGAYVTLGVSKEIELPAPSKDWSIGITPQLITGWGSADGNKYRYNWGVDSAHFTDLLFSLNLPIKYKGLLNISPGVYQVWLLDSEIKNAAGYDSKTYFGLILSVSF